MFLSLCTPAALPALQIRFWGIDSGIRHSVGGSDYTSVRVGTFMGLKIISNIAHNLQMSMVGSGSGAGSSMAAVLTAASSSLHKHSQQVRQQAAAAAQQRQQQPSDDGFFKEDAPAKPRQKSAQPLPEQQQQQQLAAIGSELDSSSDGRIKMEHARVHSAFGGYLANISPSQFREVFEQDVPTHMQGGAFLDLHGSHLDSVTSIDPAVNYAVREPTSHPVHENYRVNTFRAVLAAADALADAATAAAAGSGRGSGLESRPGASGPDAHHTAVGMKGSTQLDAQGPQHVTLNGATGAAAAWGHADGSSQPGITCSDTTSMWQYNTNSSSSSSQRPPGTGEPVAAAAGPPAALLGPLETLGELMFQSHASYSACGLGSDGTNRIINIVRQHMHAARKACKAPALYGAKITGGGCGGTVCVLGLAGSAGQAAIDAVVRQYQQETGYTPFVFGGSSMGAAKFDHLRLVRRQPA